MTGESWVYGGSDYLTIAYEASTGAQRWAARYDGPAHRVDTARSLKVSPDGTRVYVTGQSEGPAQNYATVAYDASTGAQLWAERTGGSTTWVEDIAYSLGVSPDGSIVFVTGASRRSPPPSAPSDYLTIAYDSSTGAQRWATRFDGPVHGWDTAYSLGVSPDGTTLYVTGSASYGEFISDDYTTIAYDASTGAERWVARYDGPPGRNDVAFSLAVSPDGANVFVTGLSSGDVATVAYEASTGAQRWVTRYDGPPGLRDSGYSLAVSPDGTRLFVTGRSEAEPGYDDYVTIAYGVD